nr:transporter substrate-binding domain-containing protein [uncultured Cohaesibacter sp.]
MKLTSKIAIAATALLVACGSASAGEKVRIGIDGAYPPFNQLSAAGELSGFDVDISNALCDEMKADCEFVIQDWDGMIPALIAGKIDAVVASMSITPDRLKKVDFSKKYYNTPPGIAVLKDSKLEGKNVEELKGLTIGAQVSTTHSDYAEKKIPDIDLRLYPTPDEYKMDLESGRVDAVIDDSVVLSEWVKSEAGACCKMLMQLKPVPEINGEGAGIAVKKGNTELADKFTAAIAAIRENGKYMEINNKYFDFDVYGGD